MRIRKMHHTNCVINTQLLEQFNWTLNGTLASNDDCGPFVIEVGNWIFFLKVELNELIYWFCIVVAAAVAVLCYNRKDKLGNDYICNGYVIAYVMNRKRNKINKIVTKVSEDLLVKCSI